MVAGVEFKGATSFAGGFTVTQSGGPDPDQQGAAAHAAMGPRARPLPTFVLQGTADGVLAKVNGDQVAAQWRRTNTLVLGEGAIDPVASIPGTAGYPFTRMVHRTKASGASVVEYYMVGGLGHAWPGGKDGGSYSDVRGPDASALLWAFFAGRTKSAPLDVPPVVVPTPPATLPDGGSSPTDPGAPQQPSEPSAGTAPADEGASSSDGCAVASPRRRRNGLAAFGVASLAVVTALLAARRPRKRP